MDENEAIRMMLGFATIFAAVYALSYLADGLDELRRRCEERQRQRDAFEERDWRDFDDGGE